jgi:glycosyltransferase involved in cell wall biosynthesis
MIGVVIPVHNQAAYLGEALDSIAAQTLPPAAVVVVDDGSTDGSADVARDRGISTIVTPQRGTGAARNTGVAALDTPLIAFVDADDRITPEHHAALSAALGDADAACGRAIQFFDPPKAAELAQRYRIDPEPTLARQAGALLIRRERYLAIGGFGEDPGMNELFDFFQDLGEFARTDAVVLERRIHGANRTIAEREHVRAQYLASARAAILRRRQQQHGG